MTLLSGRNPARPSATIVVPHRSFVPLLHCDDAFLRRCRAIGDDHDDHDRDHDGFAEERRRNYMA